MAWEEINKLSSPFGDGEWMTKPCIRATVQGITINSVAATLFGLQAGRYVKVLFDHDTQSIGLRLVPKGEETHQCFRLLTNTGNKANSLYVAGKHIRAKLKPYVNLQATASMQADSRLITADFSNAVERCGVTTRSTNETR